MFSIWTLSAVTVGYLAILFVIANWADKKRHISNKIYALALGVHCTSWAFFGTATQASQFSWPVVPTYLGCILVMFFALPVMKKIASICRRYQVTSLAEFLSTRFFHSTIIGYLVMLICIIGVIPYIALQLDAVSDAIQLLTGAKGIIPNLQISFYITLTMAIYVVLFGNRSLDLTQKHPGLMYTLAFESLIKLGAICCVGLFVVYDIHNGFFNLMDQALSQPDINANLNQPFAFYIFASHVLLGICAMFCLPRQFHVNFVENRNTQEIDKAQWLFPAYLIGMTSFILPIAIAGDLAYGLDSGYSDQYVLLLPLENQSTTISLIAYIGGIAAATSMVIVATLALSNMVNTNLITPLWLMFRKHKLNDGQLSRKQLLFMRQLVICCLLFIAYLYHLSVSEGSPLVKSGTIAIALIAQLTPAVLIGLYWRKTNQLSVILGILLGASVVILKMLLPAMSASYYHNAVPSDNEFADAIFFSLTLNTASIILLSVIFPNKKANPFARQKFRSSSLQIHKKPLQKIMASVLTDETLREFNSKMDNALDEDRISPLILVQAEKLLSAHLGSASARMVLNAISSHQITDEEELTELIEQASQTFKFRHEVLQSALAHLPQGVSVADQNLELIAWNPAYEKLFNFPVGFLDVGMKIADILHYNAAKGLLNTLDNENIDKAIKKRLQMMKAGEPYKFMRRFGNRDIVEISGNTLPGGGYITAYNDISEHFHTQQALKQATVDLEARVDQRTKALAEATEQANQANISKTKFLAAAGHDLMQPVNAATLFASMLTEKLTNTAHYETSKNLLSSLENVDQQLAMLLEISKLDSDRIHPKKSVFALNDLFISLVDELSVVARQNNLTLKFVKTTCIVETDKPLLTRILQNLISNAIRYTENGLVLIGLRRKAGKNREIWVCDTGTGITESNLDSIFEEFSRLDRNRQDQGLGLGLAIVKRTCDLLGLQVGVSSSVDSGSIFKISIDASNKTLTTQTKTSESYSNRIDKPAQGTVTLILENDLEVQAALRTQFEDWGATVFTASCSAEIADLTTGFDLIFADYHLNNEENGIDATIALRNQFKSTIPAVLSSADRSDNIRELASAADMKYLPKPVKSPALKRLIASLLNGS